VPVARRAEGGFGDGLQKLDGVMSTRGDVSGIPRPRQLAGRGLPFDIAACKSS